MTCEPCTYSLEQEADFLQTSSLDTRQLSLLSGIDMPAKSCESEPPKDGFPNCTCGKATSDCLTHPNTPEKWIASMQGSLARILATPENKQGLAKKRAVASTVKSSASLGWFDQAASSWRTSQQSWLMESEQSLETWPRSGMTANGFVYELPIVGRITYEIDGGFVPTPTATEAKSESMSIGLVQKRMEESTRGVRLAEFLLRRMIPTPNAGSSHWGGRLDELGGKGNPFRGTAIGKLKLNPVWMEIIMGFPPDFSALKHSEMPKSRSKQQSLGNSLEASK